MNDKTQKQVTKFRCLDVDTDVARTMVAEASHRVGLVMRVLGDLRKGLESEDYVSGGSVSCRVVRRRHARLRKRIHVRETI